jgi:sporulation protein YlmC with PRC-barrel domain
MIERTALGKGLTKGLAGVGIAAALCLGATGVHAQTSSSRTKIGATEQQTRTAEKGWSAKKNFLDQAVYNDNNDKIGSVDDLVMVGNRSEAYAVIGVGGFIGAGKRDVVVPADQLRHEGDKLILSGATKDSLKALPEFKYTGREERKSR